MAIPAVSASYSGKAPASSGQILASELSGDRARSLYGFGQATLDGTLTAFTMNFIDGTATLPFTPSAVVCVRFSGATDTAAASISVLSASSITATGFTVNISAAGSAAQLLSVAFIVIK